MADIDLKKLKRNELLTMLVQVTKRCDELEEELAVAKKELENRKVNIAESGTLAEAVLKINGMMEAADKAIAQYKENIMGGDAVNRNLSEEEIEATKEKCRRLEEETKKRCKALIEKTQQEAKAYLQKAQEKANENSTVESLDNEETVETE